jgi:CDP-diacylglycerol--serine O-phosphatidyltransferase
LDLPEPKIKPAKHGRLRRGIYILPSLFTVGTLICGYYAILSTLKGTQMLAAGIGAGLSLVAFDTAAKAIGWGIVFDGLDGLIARLTNSTSDFGREFDSLADVITFGVAPAFLAYAWGVRALDKVYGTQLVHYVQQVGWIVTFAYVICGAARLARFNIDSVKPSSDRRHFVGLPIPAAASVIASLVHWAKYPVNNWVFGVAWLGIIAVLAPLMVSRVRYYSFKAVDLRRRRPYVAIIVLGLIVWAIWAFSEQVLVMMALTYLLSGPIARLTSRFRSHPPAPEEVHAA